MPNGDNFAPVLKVLKDTNAQELKLRFYGTNIHLSILHKDIGCNIPPIKGANRKVIRNGDFFRLKTSPITSIRRFSWFKPSRGFGDF